MITSTLIEPSSLILTTVPLFDSSFWCESYRDFLHLGLLGLCYLFPLHRRRNKPSFGFYWAIVSWILFGYQDFVKVIDFVETDLQKVSSFVFSGFNRSDDDLSFYSQWW